jgi:hypothetical protein
MSAAPPRRLALRRPRSGRPVFGPLGPALAALLLLSTAATPRRPGTTWHWDRIKGRHLALLGPDGEVWRFRYGQDLNQAYFHPLATADGRVLTADRPPDHIWHHGLWFSWKYIRKVNYWEIEPRTGRPAGRTSWKPGRIQARRDGSARIALDLDYRPAGAPSPVLVERRILEISAPGSDGVYAIDWRGEFRAAQDLDLDRTPLLGEPNGQVNGGYAGLALRLAGSLEGLRLMTDRGPAAPFENDRYRGRHAGLDFSGRAGGRPAGIAILDHPSNPRSPVAWYAVQTAVMSFFNPALLSPAPLLLRAGERMTLRYRILVHPGIWDAARLREESARFSRVR